MVWLFLSAILDASCHVERGDGSQQLFTIRDGSNHSRSIFIPWGALLALPTLFIVVTTDVVVAFVLHYLNIISLHSLSIII